MTGVHIARVTKSYPLPGGTRKHALKGVDLDIAPGEFVCLLGPSGCGKSTLLNILSGLDSEYEGEVAFPETGRLRTSYIFQEARLLPWMTVRNNLRFVLDDGRDSDAHQRIERWLERVGLAGYGDYYPGQLSVGMQQRVSVARALILEPELLLMDEPFSSLDELTALRMRMELLDLWDQARPTVVFVTHNPMEAVYLADRVVIMTTGPGRISHELLVNTELPRPRDFEDQRLWQLSREAVRHLMGDSREGLGAGSPIGRIKTT